MSTFSTLFNLAPSVVLLVVWATGAIVVATRPASGPWRTLALLGFLSMAAASLANLVVWLYVRFSEPMSSMVPALKGTGLLTFFLHLVGAILLMSAMVSGRSSSSGS